MDTELLQTRTSRLYKRVSKLVREKVGKSGHPCPIEYVEGNIYPHTQGDTYYFSNKSGDIIRYPNAYMKAFGKPIYHPSTLRIVVGLKWIEKNVK